MLYCFKFLWFTRLPLVAAWLSFTFPCSTSAQDSSFIESEVDLGEWDEVGPRAALAFEKRYRENDVGMPVPLDACQNIQPLTEEFWNKKHVLTDFKQFRTEEQVGAIVIVKTEYCCEGSRLCAVATACMEKESTPLVGRFRIYAAWIKNSPEHEGSSRHQWDEAVINEYGFVQGPGARIVVMVPTFDGNMYQWMSDASDLGLSVAEFERNEGRTPELERFLAEAVKYAPRETPAIGSTND